MTEQRKTKASELLDDLRQRRLTPEEREARDGPRPKLRLEPTVLDRTVGAHANMQDVLTRLGGEGTAKMVVLHDADSGASAVAVPVEQYLELVTSFLKDGQVSQYQAGLDGRIAPSAAALAELGVEQVNPRDTWGRVADYDPTTPAPE